MVLMLLIAPVARYACTALFLLALMHLEVAATPLHLFTYADIPHPGLCGLLRSSAHFNVTSVTIIGMSKWHASLTNPDTESDDRGAAVFAKLKAFHDELARQIDDARLAPDDLVLFTDAFDVMLARPAPALAASLLRLLEPKSAGSTPPAAVAGGEINCWPWQHTVEGHGPGRPHGDFNGGYRSGVRYSAPPLAVPATADGMCDTAWDAHRSAGGGPFPYINSGMYAGRATRLLGVTDAAARWMTERGETDDQAALWLAGLERPGSITIDREGDAFLNTIGLDPRSTQPSLCTLPAGGLATLDGYRMSGGGGGGQPPHRWGGAGVVQFNDPPHKALFVECWGNVVPSMRPPRISVHSADHGRSFDLTRMCVDMLTIPASVTKTGRYHDFSTLVPEGWANVAYDASLAAIDAGNKVGQKRKRHTKGNRARKKGKRGRKKSKRGRKGREGGGEL
jgi:hypothetical protein